MRWFTDLVFLVPLRVRRFRAAHPDEPVLDATATKAARSPDPLPLERGIRWVVARRGVFVVTDRRIVCGDWEVPHEAVQGASLARVRGGCVLRVATEGAHYQFGLQTDAVVEHLPYEVARSEERLRMSALSVAARVVVGVYLVWYVVELLT